MYRKLVTPLRQFLQNRSVQYFPPGQPLMDRHRLEYTRKHTSRGQNDTQMPYWWVLDVRTCNGHLITSEHSSPLGVQSLMHGRREICLVNHPQFRAPRGMTQMKQEAVVGASSPRWKRKTCRRKLKPWLLIRRAGLVPLRSNLFAVQRDGIL